ncbi:MAG: transcription termination/antitermination NusG family protein [Peptostreptococcaceae bacterium]|nr:transcription termination/antitermination NusG family protein [Peptostreptococcaceae bacterium]
MYVVQLRPMSELKAKNRLLRKGYSAIVPMEHRFERRQGKWHTKVRILFSSYLFIDKEELTPKDYHRILENEYVLRFLGEKGNPTKLSSDEANFIRFLDAHPELIKLGNVAKGDTVSIHGVDARIVEIQKRQKRAVFEIDLAGEIHQITLSCQFEQDDEEGHGLIRPHEENRRTEYMTTGH